MKRIFIIEDDMVIANGIKEYLNTWGLESICANDFFCVLDEIKEFSPHLILLDISLPSKNGYVICSELRKTSNIPIIFMSSAGEDMNIIMAMNMGGDDFIIKPFSLEVLAAKINSLLRRSYDFNNNSTEIQTRGLILDIENAKLKYENKTVVLTKNEFIILKKLMDNIGKIISREVLMEKLWDNEAFVDDNTLTVNVTRLRKKLSEIGCNNFIQTRKNMGYIIDEIH